MTKKPTDRIESLLVFSTQFTISVVISATKGGKKGNLSLTHDWNNRELGSVFELFHLHISYLLSDVFPNTKSDTWECLC